MLILSDVPGFESCISHLIYKLETTSQDMPLEQRLRKTSTPQLN